MRIEDVLRLKTLVFTAFYYSRASCTSCVWQVRHTLCQLPTAASAVAASAFAVEAACSVFAAAHFSSSAKNGVGNDSGSACLREGERKHEVHVCRWCQRERFIYYLKYRSHLPKRMIHVL